MAGRGPGGRAGAGVRAGGGAVVLHEDIAVAKLGEAAAPGSASTPSPRCPSLGLGTPAPCRGACPPRRVKAARGLPPLLLGALSHRLPSQPEDTQGRGHQPSALTAHVQPGPGPRAASGREGAHLGAQLLRRRSQRQAHGSPCLGGARSPSVHPTPALLPCQHPAGFPPQGPLSRSLLCSPPGP